MTDDGDIEAFRDRLLAERQSLTEASVQTAEDRAPVTLDQQSVGRLSRMDAMQQQAMASAQEARRKTRIRMIDAALARMAEGEFGFCITCGEAIATKRLEIDAASPQCIGCAR